MNDIETRLRDALTARADLVQPEHLTAAAPIADFRPPWWHRSGPLLAVAAVARPGDRGAVPGAALTGGEKSGGRDDFAAKDPHLEVPEYWYFQHPKGLPERWNELAGVEPANGSRATSTVTAGRTELGSAAARATRRSRSRWAATR